MSCRGISGPSMVISITTEVQHLLIFALQRLLPGFINVFICIYVGMMFSKSNVHHSWSLKESSIQIAIARGGIHDHRYIPFFSIVLSTTDVALSFFKRIMLNLLSHLLSSLHPYHIPYLLDYYF